MKNQTYDKSNSEIDELLDEILNTLRTNAEVVSLTLAGSSYRRRELAKYNDLDLVLLLRKLSVSGKEIVENALKRIACDYTTPTLDVVLEDRIGHFFRKTSKNSIVMLHLLLFDLELYKKYFEINQLTPSSWQFYRPLIGKSLTDILPMRGITKQNVLYSRSGIYDYIYLLKERKMSYLTLEWTGQSFEYVSRKAKLSHEDSTEFAIHVILKSAANVLRLFEEIEVGDEEKIATTFKEKFPDFAFRDTPALVLEEKKRIRAMNLYDARKNAQQRRHEATQFLTELVKLVEELPMN